MYCALLYSSTLVHFPSSEARVVLLYRCFHSCAVLLLYLVRILQRCHFCCAADRATAVVLLYLYAINFRTQRVIFSKERSPVLSVPLYRPPNTAVLLYCCTYIFGPCLVAQNINDTNSWHDQPHACCTKKLEIRALELLEELRAAKLPVNRATLQTRTKGSRPTASQREIPRGARVV